MLDVHPAENYGASILDVFAGENAINEQRNDVTKKGTDIRPAKGSSACCFPEWAQWRRLSSPASRPFARLTKPIGSMTQMGTIRLGKRTDNRTPKISDFVPLATLDDLVFGGWDIFEDNAYEAAKHAGVLSNEDLEKVRRSSRASVRCRACSSRVREEAPRHATSRPGKSKMDIAEQLMADIERFKTTNDLDRCVAVWCGSTEVYREPSDVHSTLAKFEAGLQEQRREHRAVGGSTRTRCLRAGVPFANGAPNLSVDFPAIQELAKQKKLPICGKDFKTGQTLMKTILAPGFKARYLGLEGWYSTNILGNRDGEVLDDPESFRSKEVSKLGVLEHILQPHLHPDLYKDFAHVVRINYYPPRGDNKEGWDNIDIFGWLGYKMQIKIDFLCRDSILAAPIVLDLALYMDLAQPRRHGRHSGVALVLLQEPDDARKASTRSTTCSSSS